MRHTPLEDADEEHLVRRTAKGDRAAFEEFYRRVVDATEFERVGVFPGQEDPQFTHYLYRLKE